MHPVHRKVAAEYAKKPSRLVRLTDEEFFDFIEEDPREDGLYISANELLAVTKKGFADYNAVTLRTVENWLGKGLPVLRDGAIPLAAAGQWVERYQEHVTERRSYGRRPVGVGW